MEEKYIDVKGIRTRYLEAGAGEPLLLVHGGGFGMYANCNANDWEPVIDRFAKSFRVLAIDKIGSGFTDNPKSDDDYVIGSAVQHAYDFLTTLNIYSAHMAGHSRGGYAVTRLALEHPEIVKTLIIVSSSTLMTPPNPIYDEWDKQAAQIEDIREKHRYLIAVNSFSGDHINNSFLDVTIAAANLSKTQEARAKMDSGLNAKFKKDLVARQNETHELIKAGGLKAPVIIMWGFNDPSATFDRVGLPTLRLIMQYVPRCEMHILNQAGHYCYREQPAAFVEVVTGFIKLNSL